MMQIHASDPQSRRCRCLKDQPTLEPNGEHDNYTWVFTPKGAIIYRRWQHRHTGDYVRRSQLGSGKPMACAGEC
ncbi:hypothetical protein [Pseudomonas asplenii]|uniref:hypothetical protein n=1 Tax=Pseudomonas asplenii TaxID=53407 RepID=UPI00037D7BB8|nr:hypothetical protein [Pseudomonas fuscovaginae]